MKHRLLAILASVALLMIASTGAVNTAPAAQTTPTRPARQGLARFDEAAGVFSVHYPPDFRQVRRLPAGSDSYSYTFGTDAGDAALAVSFTVFSDEALTDDEWELVLAILGPDVLLAGLGDIFEVEFAEGQREQGESGAHTLYWDGESAAEELRCALRVEESDGVLALIAIAAPTDQWAERQDLFQESLGSLAWSPEAAREQIGVSSVTEDEADATEIASDILIEPSPEPSDTPEVVENIEDGDTPAVETPEGTETPELMGTPRHNEIPEDVDVIELDEIDGGVESPDTGPTPADVDVIQVEETPASSETTTFEDPDGVFRLTYPAEFENAQGPSMDEGNYVYAVWIGDGSHYIAVVFNSLADEALSDEEWEQAADPMIEAAADNFAEDATQKFRTVGDWGEHWLYIELDSKSADARAFYYMNEAEGVLAMVLGQVPRDEWLDWEDRLVEAVDTFVWWPDAAREVLTSEQPIEPEPSEDVVEPEPTE